MEKLIYKSIYYDKTENKAIVKEDEFEITNLGSKWIYLKELDSVANIPIQFQINNYNLSKIHNFVHLNKKKSLCSFKVNREIVKNVYHNNLNLGEMEITTVYFKSDTNPLSNQELINLMVKHETDFLKERMNILQNVMATKIE